MIVQLAGEMSSFLLLNLDTAAGKVPQLSTRSMQSLFCLLGIGNVVGQAGETHDLTALVPHRETTVAYPANRPVRPDDAISEVVRLCTRLAPHGREDLPFVFQMNRVQPRFWGEIQARATAAPDGFVSWAHIEHLRILGIAQPKHFTNILSQFAKTLLAHPQSLLGSLLLSDITRDCGCAANFSFAVLNGRDRQRNRYKPAVFAKTRGLEMFDGFAALDPR